MRVIIYLGDPGAPLTVPVAYSYFLQAALYSLLDKDLAAWIHNEGLTVHKRKVKPICFSRLLGEYVFDREKGQITFTNGTKLVVSSPLQDICQSLATGFLKRGEITINSCTFPVTKLEVQEPKVEGTSVLVRTLSPVTVYATMFRLNGAKYTSYFSPGDPDFVLLCRQNQLHKAQALGWQNPSEPDIAIRFTATPRIDLIKYKNIIIKAHSGHAWISGPVEYLQLAVDAGLGAKNSAGFGCLGLIRSSTDPADDKCRRPKQSDRHRGGEDASDNR